MNPSLVSLAAIGLILGSMMFDGADAEAAIVAPAVAFGMDAAAVAAQTEAGVKPDFGTFWIGPWTLSSGWGGPDGQLVNLKNAGVTPAIHFYYWGDDISPNCVENGCWSSLHNAQKTRAGWEQLGVQLTDHLNAKLAGAPAVIFLESEFNKGGIETYEPFDGYMTDMATGIHARYPAAVIVLGFGNWGSNYWINFDRIAAESDMVGIQGLRGSTRGTLDSYYALYDTTLVGVQKLQSLFHKPIMVTDIGLSSYPEPDYLTHQANSLKEFFTGMANLKSAGVQAIIYRSWRDSPNMDLANYYGEAERHWGLAYAASLGGGIKPAGTVWIDGVKAERAQTGSTSPPSTAISGSGATIEAESFTTRTKGGLQSDALASGGKMWNLWSNGYLQESFNVSSGDYDVTIRARGTWANGVAPHMEVTLGGTALLSADPGTAYEDHRARRTLSGPMDLRIMFTNDVLTTTEDRNLILDLVRFTRVAVNSAPIADFSASSTDLTVTVDAASSTDPDGDPLSYAWDFGDGNSSAGRAASHTFAAAGEYAVSLTVTDDHGAADTMSKTVTVAGSGITLGATGYKIKGMQKVDLAWKGATTVSMDVLRNGVVVATTANDGLHTDSLNKRGGGSYTYKVCEAGTSTCSNAVNILF